MSFTRKGTASPQKFSRYASLALAVCGISHALAEPVVVTNAKGYGFDDKRQLVQFQTLVFDDATGKVLARGPADLAKAYADAKIIDAKGKAVIPGLIDGHGHVLNLGQNLSQVELRDTSSEAHAVAKVIAFAKQQPQAQWILGRGWNQVLWPSQQFPTTQLLDEAIKDRPVWLSRVDGHAGWANSKALQLAGITKDSIDPPGGQIQRDKQGTPTGVLIDNAMLLVEKQIPKANPAEISAALNAAYQHLLALGITSTHDAGVDEANLAVYQQMASEHKIPLRIYAMLSATDANLASRLAAGPIDDPQDILDVRSVKIYGDGALGSRGAALLSAYQDKPGEMGLLLTQPDALTAVMKLTLESGFQANVHAIGDRANRLVLDRFELLQTPAARAKSRNRIEHAQVIAPKDLARFARLQVLPSMQPTHATSDKNMAGDRLGVARLRGAYAWRTLMDMGNPVVCGSDYPVELANPFHGLHAAVTRQDQSDQPAGGWLPEQKLSLVEALRCFTVDAAYGAYQEQAMGSLSQGQWADFLLLDQDIFTIEPKHIWQTKVLNTYVGGKLAAASTAAKTTQE
jgi:predicted amidohydrolase YtcJ